MHLIINKYHMLVFTWKEKHSNLTMWTPFFYGQNCKTEKIACTFLSGGHFPLPHNLKSYQKYCMLLWYLWIYFLFSREWKQLMPRLLKFLIPYFEFKKALVNRKVIHSSLYYFMFLGITEPFSLFCHILKLYLINCNG